MEQNCKICLSYIPAVVITAGIAVVSLAENPEVPDALGGKDKLLHGAMYAVMAFVWLLPVSRRLCARVKPYIYVWAGVTAYGGLLELLQQCCTLTRSGEAADLYADAIGAAAGVAAVALWKMLGKPCKSQ